MPGFLLPSPGRGLNVSVLCECIGMDTNAVGQHSNIMILL